MCKLHLFNSLLFSNTKMRIKRVYTFIGHYASDTSLALFRWFIPQPITTNNSPFHPPNGIFHSPSYKPLQ